MNERFQISRTIEIAVGIIIAGAVGLSLYLVSQADWRTADQEFHEQEQQADRALQQIQDLRESIESAERYDKLPFEEKMKVIRGERSILDESPATDQP